MPSELVYDYIRMRTELSRNAFISVVATPVLLYERVTGEKALTDRTLTDVEMPAPMDVVAFLERFRLRIRDEAHNLRLVRLPPDGNLTVGRAPDNALSLSMRSISKYHALIGCADGHVLLTDLGSRNGCFVDGQRVPPDKPVLVHSRQIIRVGSMPLRVLDGGDLHDMLAELTVPARGQA